MADGIDERQARLAKNEALWREVNESISAVGVGAGPDEHLYEFLCECSNIDCDVRLTTTTQHYEAVRAVPEQFLIAPGHELPEIERVVDENERYFVVEKFGEGGAAAVRLDPRRRSVAS